MNRRTFLGFLAALPLARYWPNAGGMPPIPPIAPLTDTGVTYLGAKVMTSAECPPGMIFLMNSDIWHVRPSGIVRIENVTS